MKTLSSKLTKQLLPTIKLANEAIDVRKEGTIDIDVMIYHIDYGQILLREEQPTPLIFQTTDTIDPENDACYNTTNNR